MNVKKRKKKTTKAQPSSLHLRFQVKEINKLMQWPPTMPLQTASGFPRWFYRREEHGQTEFYDLFLLRAEVNGNIHSCIQTGLRHLKWSPHTVSYLTTLVLPRQSKMSGTRKMKWKVRPYGEDKWSKMQWTTKNKGEKEL